MKKDNIIALQDNDVYQSRSEPQSIIVYNNLINQINYALSNGMPLKQIQDILQDCALNNCKKVKKVA